MDWWREARFGMFIHWGLYAVPAGKFGYKTGYGEWILDSAQIPVSAYEQYRSKFNPVKFDPDAWVKMAKQAGMKYIIFTTKHHDGFALFDSKYTAWDVMGTPYRRDIMKQLAEACKKGGIKLGWYHSIMDWHHPDYLPRRGWESRPIRDASFDRYVAYLRNQVTELLTKYGDIAVMWFDGQWEATWNHQYGQDLYDLCRKLQPDIIVNDRVDVGIVGDYGTPEQTIPDEAPGGDWETCMTMNRHWGYNAADKEYKSSTDLIRMLCDIASKGGNYLLNVGPTALGKFPPESVERLKAIGEWMQVNGESIYETSSSPMKQPPWGRATMRSEGDNSKLFLHVFEWPKDGRLVVPNIGSEPMDARFLGQRDTIKPRGDKLNLILPIPARPPHEACSVLVLTFRGAPIFYADPKIEAISSIFVERLSVEIDGGSSQLQTRYTLDGPDPGPSSPVYGRPIVLSRATTIKARTYHRGEAVTPVVESTFTRVEPWPAGRTGVLQAGIEVGIFEGQWTTVLDFANQKPSTEMVAATFALPESLVRDDVGAKFTGYLRVPADDIYRFALSSDDGAQLWIDGNLVIDNDGLHSIVEKSGAAPLARGDHSIRVDWFNATGGAQLGLKWSRSAEPLAPVSKTSLGR
ncbi:MAG: alpha-L-fucosidase [Fimbriimonadales bacterium]